MKKIIAFVLCCAVFIVSGCNQSNIEPQSGKASLQGSESTIASGESTQEASVDAPKKDANESKEISPVNSNLTVPLQIVTVNDNFKAYDNGKKGNLFVNEQSKIDFVQEFMENLDYSSITAMYGEAQPVFQYSQSNMSLKDSLLILENLKKSVAFIKKMPQESNPYTGGGCMLSVHQGEKITTFLFNGGWLTVSFQDQEQQWIFDVDKTPAQDLLLEIQNLLFDNMDKGDTVSAKIIYQGSEIEGFYAVDIKNYLMAEIKDPAYIRKIIDDFEKIDYNREDFNGYGFLLFNGDGKQYHYLHNSDQELPLAKNAVAALANSKLHPSWLIHFAPERVISVNDVADKEKIAKFCDFLKKEVTVEKMTSVLDNTTSANSGAAVGDLVFKVKFDSDVSYNINVRDNMDGTGYISIYTGD